MQLLRRRGVCVFLMPQCHCQGSRVCLWWSSWVLMSLLWLLSWGRHPGFLSKSLSKQRRKKGSYELLHPQFVEITSFSKREQKKSVPGMPDLVAQLTMDDGIWPYCAITKRWNKQKNVRIFSQIWWPKRGQLLSDFVQNISKGPVDSWAFLFFFVQWISGL